MTSNASFTSRPAWLARQLGPTIDAAAVDGHRTLVHRVVIGGLVTAMLVANLDIQIGIVWLFILCGSEALAWSASRRQLMYLPGTALDRLVYLLCVGVATLNWSFLPLFFWISGRPGLQYVSIVIASAMLIHAQAFTYRSRAVLAIQAGIPAMVLVVLLLVYSNLKGVEWATAAIGVLATLFYIAASAKANRANARALDRSRDELELIAYSDALTTLSNRRRFTEDIRQLMDYSRRHDTRFALVLIDLDRFKQVNDDLGHDVGDALLVEAARKLKSLLSPEDRIARLGGDEFAVLIANAGDSNRIPGFCQRVIESFSAGVNVNGTPVSATSSVGVAIFPNHGQAQDALYKAADQALYAAKNSGRNTWRLFEQGLLVSP